MNIIRHNAGNRRPRSLTALVSGLFLCTLGLGGLAASSSTADSSPQHAAGSANGSSPAAAVAGDWQPSELRVNRQYNEEILNKVDHIIRKELYSADLANNVWPKALEAHKEAILRSTTLCDLFQNMNAAIAELKSSHCEFATENDEIFYFLHDLFGKWNRKMRLPKSDYTGFVTGPPRFANNQVRYVLDDSPASKAGIQVGDHILTVDAKPYVGQMNFIGRALKPLSIGIERSGKKMQIELTPVKSDFYAAYVEAMRKSARKIQVGKHSLGYFHVWCGGSDSRGALEEALGGKLHDTDGLILDLRDGYGGNSTTDLDIFYRPAKAFPPFTTKTRAGKTETENEYYDKPIVAIINDGARSGKELLANSLKLSGRAVLVGQRTAGAVLAGRLFPIDRKTALYLAVTDVTVGGVRIEGAGVSPDIEIDDRVSDAGKREQLEKAQQLLLDKLTAKPN